MQRPRTADKAFEALDGATIRDMPVRPGNALPGVKNRVGEAANGADPAETARGLRGPAPQRLDGRYDASRPSAAEARARTERELETVVRDAWRQSERTPRR